MRRYLPDACNGVVDEQGLLYSKVSAWNLAKRTKVIYLSPSWSSWRKKARRLKIHRFVVDLDQLLFTDL